MPKWCVEDKFFLSAFSFHVDIAKKNPFFVSNFITFLSIHLFVEFAPVNKSNKDRKTREEREWRRWEREKRFWSFFFLWKQKEKKEKRQERNTYTLSSLSSRLSSFISFQNAYFLSFFNPPFFLPPPPLTSPHEDFFFSLFNIEGKMQKEKWIERIEKKLFFRTNSASIYSECGMLRIAYPHVPFYWQQ